MQGVLYGLEVIHFAVCGAHKLVKMDSKLALQRHHGEEAIHQKALSDSHATPHVDSSWQGWMD
jgi:hypothetical protein